MHFVEFKHNPSAIQMVERIDLRTAKTLRVDCGWRTGHEATEFLEKVRAMLAEKGFTPELHADHALRHGGVIIGPIFYRLAWKDGTTAMAYGAKVCQAFMKAYQPLMEWCYANCEKEPVLEKDGLRFFTDDDYLLYTMRFGGKQAQEG